MHLTCEYCGKTFDGKDRHTRYCCATCKREAKNTQARNRYRKRHPLHEMRCHFCGNLFTPNNGNQIYCGHECQYAACNRFELEKPPIKPERQDEWLILARACEAVMKHVADCEQEIEWLNCQLENALTASAERMLMDAIADKQALIIEQAAKIAELQGKLASAAIEKPVKSKEPSGFGRMKFNCCERLKLKQISALPCGKRIACFMPGKCKHVPKGATLEAARELTTRAMSGAPARHRVGCED